MRGKVTTLPPVASTLEESALREWSFGLTRGGGCEGNTRMNSSNPPQSHLPPTKPCRWDRRQFRTMAAKLSPHVNRAWRFFSHPWIDIFWGFIVTNICLFFLSRFTQRNILFPSSAEREHWDRCSDSCASFVHSEYHVKRDHLKKQAFYQLIHQNIWVTHTQAMSRFKFMEMGQFKVFARQPKHCSHDRPCLCFI